MPDTTERNDVTGQLDTTSWWRWFLTRFMDPAVVLDHRRFERFLDGIGQPAALHLQIHAAPRDMPAASAAAQRA
jgi:hypothetical protein